MTGRKVRFNAIDAIIILFFAAAVGVLLYIFVFSNKQPQITEGETRTIQYVVEIPNLDKTAENAVQIGQSVQDGVTRKFIGKVVGVLPVPFEKLTFNYESGHTTTAAADNKITLKLTVEAEVTESDRAFTINGYDIRIGELFSLLLPEFYGVGYCTDMIIK